MADQGKPSAVFYKNPIAVLLKNLPGYGYRPSFTVVQPIVVGVRYRGKLYDVYLAQLAKRGPGGAWLITAIVPHGVKPPGPPGPGTTVARTPTPAGVPRLGNVSRTGQQVSTIQSRVTAGDKSFTYYLNPVEVLERNLTSYGFTVPVPLVQPLKIAVLYKGAKYEASLIQPVKKGTVGIWVVSRIDRRPA